MLNVIYLIESIMEPIAYEVIEKDNQKLVSLDGFLMDADQLNDWMVGLRDEDPDLYSQLVPVFVKIYRYTREEANG